MSNTTAPRKASDIGLKQLRAVANLAPPARLDVIAEGLPLLLRSAETLYAARDAAGGGRVGEILRGHAIEEAAKILILLDYVRCPLGLSDRAQGQLRAFYDHGARLIYAQACSWSAVDVSMLRGYVDSTRASHYVEGDYGEYIMPNWELYRREARLYADVSRMDSGELSWNDPDQWSDLELVAFDPAAVSVARALARVGAFSRVGLGVIHDIWSPTAFEDAQDHTQARSLLDATLERFVELALPSDDAAEKDLRTVYTGWQLPMYAIDVVARPVALEDLRAEQDAHLHRHG